MLTFSIFRKVDNTIVHTAQFEDYSAFRKYWLSQPAPQDFGYREINPVPKAPYVFRVVERHDAGLFTKYDKLVPLTDELCELIAKRNGYMKAGEVHASLLRGQTIYTNFSCYTLE